MSAKAIEHDLRCADGRGCAISIVMVLTIACAAGCASDVSGLRPVNPKVGGPLSTPQVDSLQPTFQWEAYPQKRHLSSLDKPATNVVYDVKLWVEKVQLVSVFWGGTRPAPPQAAGVGTSPDDPPVATGLTKPEYRCAMPLTPDTVYCWSVRARFQCDGLPRVTQWSRSTSAGIAFKTPAK
jgi:hypothetical protein